MPDFSQGLFVLMLQFYVLLDLIFYDFVFIAEDSFQPIDFVLFVVQVIADIVVILLIFS